MVKSFLDRNSCGRTSVLSCIAHLTTPSRICQERTFFPYNADVTSATRKTPAKRSEARERLLTTASDLFYAEGINSVGVDRIVSASNITAQLFEPGFRGCAFINAASEFEDPDGPIMRAVLAHRAWFYALVRDAFASAGHAQPDLAAGQYVMLRDGATTAGHLGDPSQARDAFERGVAGLLRFTNDPAKTSDVAADPSSPEAATTSNRTSSRSR